jgi:hypothetical protein
MNGITLLVLIFCLFQSCGRSTPSKRASELTVSNQLSAKIVKLPSGQIDSTLLQTSKIDFDNSEAGWFLTFEDQFEDKQTAIAKGANPNCFNKIPTCMLNWWSRSDCPEFSNQLENLNKCNWNVYHYYNYMDWDAKEGTGINAFNPNQVKVENGFLILSAEKSNFKRINCKNKFFDPRINYENYSFECPILSGGLESRKYEPNNPNGFSQKYGRFEVRAKLNHGPGSWPAHWIMPEESMEPGCGWPYSGEIDIMEATFLHKNTAGANFHTGDCQKKYHVNSGFDWSVTNEHYPNLQVSELENSFYNTFHTYAVEWDDSKIRFFYDDFFLGQINENDIIFHEKAPDGHKVVIPKKPFYWILNNTIFNANDPNKVDLANFARQEHIIDYVRVYRKCTEQDNSSNCLKINYKNTMASCPGIRKDIGDFKSKNLCKAWPHFNISQATCFAKKGELATIDSGENQGEWCAINEGTWFKARKITRQCPALREKVGEKGYIPVCKAFPHFKIKRSKCKGEIWKSNSGEDFCLWPENGWYRVRKIK